jgi:endonuclease/exonuclease/phosphatase family metal-dependent hydrolase
MMVRVGSFNVLNTSCRYQQRKSLIRQAIREMQCDVIGIQEVNIEENPREFELEEYQMFTVLLPQPMLKADPSFRIDGNCLLVKKDWKVLQESRFVYSDQQRVAQILKISKNDVSFTVVNTHLDHLSDVTREIQLKELLEHLFSLELENIVCTGDFNFLPDSRPYEIISKFFTSASFKANGKEPQITFPTGLIGEYADVDEYGCFDYIWVRGNVSVNSCMVFRSCGGGDLWASDHYPLYTDLTL